MAKISTAERAANKEKLDSIVEDIFWESGWDAVTLNSVSDRAGMGKSTIQNYYPNRKHFGEALRGKVFPVVIGALDTSSPTDFKVSWETALSTSKRFRMVVSLLISNSTSHMTNDMTIQGIVRLRHHLAELWSNEKLAYDTVLWVLGLSVLKLAES
ncbi:TetR family transcriptional regulator [Vibrio harveyi]|nr:TetR family transcriptional regulator [Vibrio harveyi]